MPPIGMSVMMVTKFVLQTLFCYLVPYFENKFGDFVLIYFFMTILLVCTFGMRLLCIETFMKTEDMILEEYIYRQKLSKCKLMLAKQ
jgi:hypothetical protein